MKCFYFSKNIDNKANIHITFDNIQIDHNKFNSVQMYKILHTKNNKTILPFFL